MPNRSKGGSQIRPPEPEGDAAEVQRLRTELRQARAELDEVRDRYHAAYHLAPVGYLTLDASGTIREANLTAGGMLGLDRTELAGRRLASFVAREELDRWRTVLPSLARPGEWRTFRMAFDRADGSTFNGGLACDCRAAPDGGVAIHVALSDVSELVRTERKCEAYVEIAPHAVFVVDGKGRIVDSNPAAVDMTGAEAKALLSMGLGDFQAPEDREAFQEQLATLAAAGRIKMEFRMVRPDGRELWVKARAVRLSGDRFLAFCEDVTARRAAEAALRRSEARFRLLAEGAPVGMFQTGPAGEVLYVNPAWLKITGLSEAEAYAPNSGQKAIHPEDADRVRKAWWEAVSSGKGFSGTYRLVPSPGVVTWVRGFGTPLRDEAGKVAGYVGVIAKIPDPPAR